MDSTVSAWKAWRHDVELIARHMKRMATQRVRALRRKVYPKPLRRHPALPSVGTTVQVDGMTFRIHDHMSPHNIRKLSSGRHGRHERDLLKDVLQPDDTVMELGGGIGSVSIACAKAVGSERVFTYEANPELESVIRENYALNQVSPTLQMCMLGREAGCRVFHVADRFERSSVFQTGQQSRSIEIPVRAFNDEVQRIRPNVLIVDIQGGEEELFSYARLDGIEKLLLEVHPDILGVRRVNALRKRIRREGFDEVARKGQDFLYLRS